MQFHTSTASGEDRPDFSKMANRFKQERVQQGKRRRWKDGVQNGGGRRWSEADGSEGGRRWSEAEGSEGGHRWDTRDYKRGRNHTSQAYHAKDNRHWDNRDDRRGRTQANEADYVKGSRPWNEKGGRDDVRKDDFRKSKQYGSPNRKPTPQVSEYITADFAERRSLQMKNPKFKGRGNLYCAICNVMCSDEKNYNKHINGRKHKNMVKRLSLKQDTKTGNDQAKEFKYSKMGFSNTDEMKQMSNEKKQELAKILEDENNVISKADMKLAQRLLDPTTPYNMEIVECMKRKDPEGALDIYKEMKHRQIEATEHICNMILQLVCTAICDKGGGGAILIKSW
eukprot:g14948.t1